MDDLFITQHFDWDQPDSRRVRWVNALLARLGFRARLVAPLRTGAMTSVEQRINLFHLLDGVLAYDVPGDVVEIGTLRGETAALLGRVVAGHGVGRAVHVYDAFLDSSPADVAASAAAVGAPPPAVHAGWFRDTLPAELPDRVCFTHVDVHWPGADADLEATVAHVLGAVYPRLAHGSVVVIADYCDPAAYNRPGCHFPHAIATRAWWNPYPAIASACDAFLRDKPERMSPLYGGCFSHGYFRKASPRPAG